jgi:hypothetical protein
VDVRIATAILAAAVAVLLALNPPAAASSDAIGPRAAERVADRDSKVVEAEAEHGRLTPRIEQQDDGSWQVSYFAEADEVAQVIVEPNGTVRESWAGAQAAWRMARGYTGQFGHALNAPYVWLPLCALFLAALLDWRRPLRVAHLDLLVLLAFGVSHIFFNHGEIGVSVPLAYLPMLYLFGRMLWLGFRGGDGLRPTVPAIWLAVAAVFLIAFRITLNVADSGVIDVGYAGVIGADRIISGEAIYGESAFPGDNPLGDTYGPASYYAYVPFQLLLPWSGEWDDLPAAHAAAIAFDLATVIGLFFLGFRLRSGRAGRDLGFALAFAWLAFPYTAFALQANANDSLVAALVVWSLVAFASPLARGSLLAVAAATKFAPLVLVPLYAAGERGLLAWPERAAVTGAGGEVSGHRARLAGLGAFGLFAGAFATVSALMLAHPAIDPGLATFWERTVASQADRDSPFSIWGQLPGLEPLRGATIAAVAGLAGLIALVPRHRPLAQVAALAAALLIATQLTTQHWFYLYIPWFLGPLLAALLAVGGDRQEAAVRPRAAARTRGMAG